MPLDIKQFFSNIGQGIKNFYYGLEDKYYDFVDWLKDHGVPLYKFTDFVDQFAPSFVVLSLIFLLLIFLGLWFFLGTSITGTTTELTATLIVLDPVNNPVQDAQVQVFLPDKTETLTTNVSGKVRFILSAEQVSARVKIEKQDFTTFDSSIDFVAGLENTINLGLITGGLAEFQGTQYTVTVTNSETGRKISGISIEGSFNCSNPAVADPLPQRTTPLANSQPTFTFSVPENCNTLTGTILASGFTQDTKQIGNQNFIFSLTPEAVQAVTGTLDVQVLDSNSRDVNNAIVRVFNSDNQVVKEGISDSHGSARLTEIPAGTYKVTATKAGQSKTNDSVEIQAGRTTAITLQFARAVSGQKLFFKIIDSNTSQNLVEAIVLIYKNSDWVSDILTTDNSGTISFALTDAVDSNTTFTALVSEEGYKTQLFRLTVQLASSTVPQTFQLVPVDPDCSGNCGNILVTVQDSEQVVQNQAQVNIYRVEFSNIPINSNPLSFFDTNTDGQVLFQGMADGTYYAKATKTEKLGQSPTRLLANGLDIELPVTIILGNGFVEVTVKQKDSDQPVVADVNFVSNFNGALLGSCRTQALDGKCTSQSIPANEFVWVQVSAEGFFPVEIGDNGRAIDIIPVTPKRIEVELTSLANIPAGEKIRLELDKICAFSPSWDCSSNTLLNSNASRDTPYLAVFNLQFLEPAVNPVFHLHIGSDLLQTLYEQGTVPPLGYKIKIEEVRAPQSVVQLYTCFKPVNDSFFTQDSSIVDCATTAAQANAKQAILSWPLVNVGERKVFAKIWIEKAQARGSSVELHAQTKGDFSGTEFLSPRLDIIRLLGEARCSPGQDVLWQFGFQAPFQGILFNPVERIGPDGLTQITVLQASESLTTSQDYSLNYQFSNCSNRTLQNVDLRIKATNVGLNDILLEQDLVFNAEPNGIPAPDGRIVSIPSLIRDSSFGPENISLFAPTKTAASTGFQFALLQAGQANIDDGVQHLRFVVQGGNQFAFEGIPEYIIANTEQTLEGVVKDYETLLPLENVIVEYRPYPGRAWSSSVHSFSTRTNAEGHYSIPLTRNNGLIIQVGDSARLMFTKPNYVEAKFWPEAQTLAGFSGIQCLIAPDLIHVSRISRETIIIQNNCSALKYKFSTDDSANLTLSQMPGSSTIAQGQEYDLASNQSLQIRIRSSSNSRFGIHPLYLMVQQSGEDTFTVGKIIDVVIESNGCLQLTAPEDYNFNFLETAEQPGTFLNTCRDQINALMYPAFTWHFDSSVGLNVLDPLPQDAYYCFMDGSAELKATAFPGFKYPGDFAVYSETPAESLITDISSSVPVPFEEGPTQVWVDDGMGLQYSVTPNRVFSALDREVQANMYSQRNSNPINFSNVTGIIDFTNQFIGENSNIFDSVLDRFMDVFNQNVGINTVLNYSAYNQLHDLFVEKLKQKVAAKFMLSNNCVIDSMLNNVVDGPLFTNAFNTKLRSLDLANYNPGLPENQITSEVCDNIINTADNCYYREGQCEAHCRQEDSCLDQCEREFKTCMQPLADQYFPIDQSLPIDQRVLDRDQQVHKVEELYSFCQSVNRIVTNLDEISSNIETVFAELNPEMDQVASNFVNRLNSKFRTLNASFTVSDLIPSKVSTGEANSFAASELQLTALTEFNDGLLRSYNSNIGPYFDSSAFEGIWIHLQDRIDNLFESLQPQSCSYFNLRNSFSNYVKQEVSAQLQAGLTQGENRTQPQQSVYVTIYNDNSQSFDHFLENFVEDMDYAYGLENDSYLMKDIAVEIISDNPDIAYDFGIDAVYARYTGENICPNTPVNISNVNFTLTNYGLTKDEYADLEISDAITQTGRTYTDIIDNEPDLEGVVQ